MLAYLRDRSALTIEGLGEEQEIKPMREGGGEGGEREGEREREREGWGRGREREGGGVREREGIKFVSTKGTQTMV